MEEEEEEEELQHGKSTESTAYSTECFIK